MKIGTDNSDGRTGGLDPLKGVTRPNAPVGRQTQPSGADQLTLSPEARLLQAARESVQSGVAVRQDVVDRLRALVAEGRLSGDAAALADSIIDSWIDAGAPPANA
jgi:flagellar biosynthesis anti-sigma factor FlgM